MTVDSVPRTWNFADVWEVVAAVRGDAPAQVQGGRTLTWAETDQRANGVAAALLDAGLGHQQAVAQYLYNCPEYLESMFACYKASLVPVNTNYRYVEGELVSLWTDAGVAAVVFDAAFLPAVAAVRGRMPGVRLWLCVGAPDVLPPWATAYEEAAAADPGRIVAPQGRSGEDLLLLYTGGTTGLPKGVMWAQDDLYRYLSDSTGLGEPAHADLEGVRRRLLAAPGPTMLPASPLMHGAAIFVSYQTLILGGCVVHLTSRSYDPLELLDTVRRHRVAGLTLVGDVFAKPLVAALDAEPGRFDLSSLQVVVSAGMTWSAASKAALLAHAPQLLLMDGLSSSEAVGMGLATTSAAGGTETGTFRIGEHARVVTEDGRDVEPGSGEVGLLAVSRYLPRGYLGDAAATARTFRVLPDGRRYVLPGDYATVEADGTVRLLGRGSLCINTGGEKVYPEEVETVLKDYPGVLDAAVVGVPDERYGEAVCAVVDAAPGALDPEALVAHARRSLAGYKVPRHIVEGRVPRAANGKLDYAQVRGAALRAVAGEPSGARA